MNFVGALPVLFRDKGLFDDLIAPTVISTSKIPAENLLVVGTPLAQIGSFLAFPAGGSICASIICNQVLIALPQLDARVLECMLVPTTADRLKMTQLTAKFMI